MNKAAIAFIILGLSGCATVDPQLAGEAAKPVVCMNKQECDLYWQRAQVWVSKNSSYRIQVVNDNVLSTYGPAELSDPTPGYSLTRVPNTDGGAAIEIDLQCYIAQFGCGHHDKIVTLKRYISTGM